MAQATAIVDFAHEIGEGELEKALAEVAQKYGLTLKVLNENGPAGGWPEVELAGEEAAVRLALVELWDADEEEQGLYMS